MSKHPNESWHRRNFISTLHPQILILGFNGVQRVRPILRTHRSQIIRRTVPAVCLASPTTTMKTWPLVLAHIGAKASPREQLMRMRRPPWAHRATLSPRTCPWHPPPTRTTCRGRLPMSGPPDVRLIFGICGVMPSWLFLSTMGGAGQDSGKDRQVGLLEGCRKGRAFWIT